jgi:sec-independent protein translocase protein TatA
MPNVGPFEIIVVLVLVLIIFGPKRLPELGHSLGKGLREFKGSLSGENDEPPVTQTIETPAEVSSQTVGTPVATPVASTPVVVKPAVVEPAVVEPAETKSGESSTGA